MQNKTIQCEIEQMQSNLDKLETDVTDAIAIKYYRDGKNDMRRECIRVMKESGIAWSIVRRLVGIKLPDPSFPVDQ